MRSRWLVSVLGSLMVCSLVIGGCDSGGDSGGEETPPPSEGPAMIANLEVVDQGNESNGQDLLVSFSKAADEGKVGSYRIIVVQAAQVGNFALATAEGLAADRFTSVAKNGSDISTTLGSNAKDSDGAGITNGVAYRIFVLVVGDGTRVQENMLSEASNAVTLSVVTDPVSNLTVSDNADNGDGRDLQVVFNRAPDEAKISEYRVLVVKSAQADGFDLAAANGVTSSRYMAVAKVGRNVSISLGTNATDTDGDVIQNGVGYRAFVLTVADGTIVNQNALAGPSAVLTLNASAGTVFALGVDDITNNGNGSDLEVAFVPPPSEANIQEYRVMVVKAANVSSFDVEAANAVAMGNYTAIIPTGASVTMVLGSDARDTDGEVLQNDQSYGVFVLSVADGVRANLNALSQPSNTLTLAVTSVKVTYIGNNGIMISDGTSKVVMDGLHRTNTGWILMPSTELTKLETGTAPYDGVRLVTVSHNHGDHFHPNSITTFLSNNPGALVLGPPQVVNGLGGDRSQIPNIAPPFRTRIDTTLNGVKLSVLHLRHFNQFNFDFSDVENYGYLVELNGVKLLHLGDVEYSDANFSNFNLAEEGIDIVVLPTFNTLLSTASRDIVVRHINPKHIIASHIRPGSNLNTEAAQAASLYMGATVFTRALQFMRY